MEVSLVHSVPVVLPHQDTKSRYKSVYQDCVRATTQLSSAHGGFLEDTMFSELDAL